MTKLTDTQRVILSAASQRVDRLALPLPKSLKGGAAHNVVNALIEKGLLKEVKADRKLGDLVWRESDEGHGLTVIITQTGFTAIGIEPEDARSAPQGADRAPGDEPATDTPTERVSAPKARTMREGTKQATLIAMLRATEGATIEEITAATNWQSHTVRGAMAGTLKKKLGLKVTSDKVDGRGRVYRLTQF